MGRQVGRGVVVEDWSERMFCKISFSTVDFLKENFQFFLWLACGCWLLASGFLFLVSFSNSVGAVYVLDVEVGC